jgi:predicted metal-dependent hydrolase
MNCKIIRSNRKTLSLQVNSEGVIVRAPLTVSDADINAFILNHKEWIDKNLEKLSCRQKELAALDPITLQDINELADKAMEVIPERVKYYAQKIGVTYGSITIRNQRTRWGSCTSNGNLNFNCLLMLAPPQVLDSVVVHELCHRKEMNHSDRFYAEVYRVYPEYDKWNKWLKENGPTLISRMQ